MVSLTRIRSLFFRLATLLAVGCAGAAQAQSTNVVEYYVASLDSYFITARAGEIAALDAQPAEFIRTGVTFSAFGASTTGSGVDSICRYYIKLNTPPVSSHFYGVRSTDCAALAASVPSGFTYEGLDFSVYTAINGSCPAAAATPVYRLLRLGDSGRNPNHRYTASSATYNQFISQGWRGEGVAFCVASATTATFKVGTDFATCATKPPVSPTASYRMPSALASSSCGLDSQKTWVRSLADMSYLWATQSPRPDPTTYNTVASYFNDILFKPTDRYSWFDDAASTYDSFSGAPTIRLGYEVGLARMDAGTLVIRRVEPNTPASRAGLNRGTLISAINGQAVGPSLTSAQYSALYPTVSGTITTLTVKLRGASQWTTVALLADLASSGVEITVDNALLLTSSNGKKVGYFAFHGFYSQSSAELVSTLTAMKSAGVQDVVLDLRYNGGGYVAVANELASMLGGDRVRGQVFNKTRFTELQPGTASSELFDVMGVPEASRLHLPRLFVLVTNRSASASELVINSLKPFLDVVLIGSTTYGKPVGSYLHPFTRSGNCGQMYAMIGFEGVNACDSGQYYNGIAPTCFVLDDLSRDLGDVNELMLAGALRYADTGTCASSAAAQDALKKSYVPLDSLEPARRTGAIYNAR
ncbi:MAG: hypothetical protein JNL19_12570 [Burkholderiales bacterium]|nr:hypothetical protein [Burkholderiales bacterium]